MTSCVLKDVINRDEWNGVGLYDVTCGNVGLLSGADPCLTVTSSERIHAIDAEFSTPSASRLETVISA